MRQLNENIRWSREACWDEEVRGREKDLGLLLLLLLLETAEREKKRESCARRGEAVAIVFCPKPRGYINVKNMLQVRTTKKREQAASTEY